MLFPEEVRCQLQNPWPKMEVQSLHVCYKVSSMEKNGTCSTDEVLPGRAVAKILQLRPCGFTLSLGFVKSFSAISRTTIPRPNQHKHTLKHTLSSCTRPLPQCKAVETRRATTLSPSDTLAVPRALYASGTPSVLICLACWGGVLTRAHTTVAKRGGGSSSADAKCSIARDSMEWDKHGALTPEINRARGTFD